MSLSRRGVVFRIMDTGGSVEAVVCMSTKVNVSIPRAVSSETDSTCALFVLSRRCLILGRDPRRGALRRNPRRWRLGDLVRGRGAGRVLAAGVLCAAANNQASAWLRG